MFRVGVLNDALSRHVDAHFVVGEALCRVKVEDEHYVSAIERNHLIAFVLPADVCLHASVGIAFSDYLSILKRDRL